ncbi:MAG TPA: hypothetical protein VMA73_23700 [Streptosporangiaceae bacterium]|nr:hypothetical protein [Streptosporangiaceae bacterium]
MRERKLIEQLAAEIEKATAAGDDQRARQLADLQCDLLTQILLDRIADPAESPVSSASRPC